MKCFNSRPLIALITFVIGISAVTFWYFRPKVQQLNVPIVEKSKDELATNINAWQTFISFENKDLRKIDRRQKDNLQEAVDALVGKTTDTGDLRLISKITNEQGEVNYLLIGESPLLTIPGDSGLRIQLFNLEGKLLNSMSFASGHRIGLKDINVKYSPEIERELIEVGSEPVINGYDVATQYYALIGEKILLIRLEDSKGQPIRNIYALPNYIIGLNIKGRSADEWQKTLESNDIAEILATLSWLNGVHWNPAKQQYYRQYKEINETELTEKVRSNENVKEKIRELAQSENTWIKDAAHLAKMVEYW